MTRPSPVPEVKWFSASVFAAFAMFAAMFLGSVFARPATADDYSHVRIVRLSFVEGDVRFQRLNDGWQTANMNLPIEEGIKVQSGAGFAEVEFEAGLYLRLAQNSTVAFTELGLMDGKRITKAELLGGSAILTANDVGHDLITMVAGNLTLAVHHNGHYRMDVSQQGAWVTVLKGKLDVEAGAKEVRLSSNHTLHEIGTDANSIEVVQSAALDAFDKWVSQRDETTQSYTNETEGYIHNGGNYGIGFADLYDYGVWYNCPGFGMCWQPYGVGIGWVPFVNGQWQCLNGFGWTWVSGEPWGWLPYHFGGWYNAPGQGWVWVPGSGRNWTSWQPGTASWVNVQNRTGWTPLLANPSNPSKVSNKETLRQSEVILAGQANGNQIRPVARVPLSSASRVTSAAAPAQSFAATGDGRVPRTFAAVPANGALQYQAAPTHFNHVSENSLARRAVVPVSGAPANAANAPRNSAMMRSSPAQASAPAIQAPHTAAVRQAMPAEMRAARSEGEFSHGSNGGNSGGGFARSQGGGSSAGSNSGGGFSRASGGSSGGSSPAAHSAPAAAPASSGGGGGGDKGGGAIKH
jgi:hypothetical protein